MKNFSLSLILFGLTCLTSLGAQELSAFSHQVAGHGDILIDKIAGILYKPLANNERELEFYQKVQEKHPSGVFPQFLGVAEIQGKKYIKLQDLTSGFKSPCMMDLKVGFRHYHDDVSAEKKMRLEEKAKKSTISSLGILLTGQSFIKKGGQEVMKLDRQVGKNLNPQGLKENIGQFFQQDPTLIDFYLLRLRELKAFLQKEGQCRLYSTSLLFTYDAENPCQAHLRLLDFGQSYWQKDLEPHQDYLVALDNVIKIIEELSLHPSQF